MTVADLMFALNEFDPDMEVVFPVPGPKGGMDAKEVEVVVEGFVDETGEARDLHLKAIKGGKSVLVIA